MRELGFPRAILFDLDGTLIDSLPDLVRSANAMRAELGGPPLGPERISRFVGNGLRRLVHRVLTDELEGEAESSRFEAGLATFHRIYLEGCCVESTLRPRAAETLERLAAMGVACGVVTNKSEAPMRRILDGYGLAGRIRAAIGGDTPFGRKPGTGTSLEALRRLGLDGQADRWWLVGDSLTDLRTAAAAGVPGIAIRGGYHHGEAFECCDPRPARIIDQLSEVADLVGGDLP
jgi:phosphoglycolate phosphatase